MVPSQVHIVGCEFLGAPSPVGNLKRKSQTVAEGKMKKKKRARITAPLDGSHGIKTYIAHFQKAEGVMNSYKEVYSTIDVKN